MLVWDYNNSLALNLRCYIENRHAAGETMIVKWSGLHLMPEKAFLDASSDGLVTCTSYSVDTCCLGCLEIKCPYSSDKNVTVEMTLTAIADKFRDKFFLKEEKMENYIYHRSVTITLKYRKNWL